MCTRNDGQQVQAGTRLILWIGQCVQAHSPFAKQLGWQARLQLAVRAWLEVQLMLAGRFKIDLYLYPVAARREPLIAGQHAQRPGTRCLRLARHLAQEAALEPGVCLGIGR
ncbi:hypothetical protein D3C79_875680 [compost metagenome]